MVEGLDFRIRRLVSVLGNYTVPASRFGRVEDWRVHLGVSGGRSFVMQGLIHTDFHLSGGCAWFKALGLVRSWRVGVLRKLILLLMI